MKNPHGVEPTRFMKKEDSQYVYEHSFKCGPIFGSETNSYSDLHIGDNCNREYSCWTKNDGNYGYDCHPKYQRSLFVNTAGPDVTNFFSLLDYEVFGIDYENRDNINILCKHPDIIWKCIETKDISEESLKQVDDDTELLTDLDAIHCNNSTMRFQISHYFFKNPSELLPGTQIVNQQYDDKLREWCGDHEWRLLYRASEHGYTASSFHEYCDGKSPTLVVIKSSGGWIFGGYTTESSDDNFAYRMRSMYYDLFLTIDRRQI